VADFLFAITQKDVDMLLIDLQQLREKMRVARETIAPLKESMALAYREYEKAIGHVRYEAGRLQAEISLLQGKIEGRDQRDTFIQWTAEDMIPLKQEGNFIDPDAIEKDVLLEHLFRVLGDEDDELLSSLTGICNDPAVRLADALERVPWGVAWMARGRQETLSTQYRRLATWKEALSKQLEELQRTTESLRKHPHFGLYQQREKGPTVWQDFLARAAEQQKEYNESLTMKLNDLREKWAGMVDNA
jgi:DNA repair exonuclease SbcCD ATPase subunit